MVTVEEHSVIGGLGDAVADVLMGKVSCKFRKIGVNDQFGQSGKAADVLREYGLTADQIADRDPGDSVTSFDAKIGRNRLISPDFSVLI